jgi:photosystem II stability/assembly factor-like uncharacterized protein
MTPDEREVRRALEARSGDVSPEFRAHLTGALQGGRPSANAMPAIAVAVVIVLSVASIGILLMARGAGRVLQGGPASGARLTSPTPTGKGPAIYLPSTAQLSAPSGNVVWAFIADSLLFRSTDGGNNWDQRSLPVSQPALWPEISFVDAQQGWYSESGSPETQCNADGTAIWHTTDGGATWQQVALVTSPPTGSSGISDSQCKEGLSFIDSNHGFLDAWDDNHRPIIYRTSDGGRTWKGSTLPDPPGFVTQDGGFSLRAGLVRVFGTTLLVPASGMNGGTQQPEMYVFKSTDGGATWYSVAKAPNAANNIAFGTASRWLQLIEPDQSSETTDSGKTWHSYLTDYAQAAPIAPDIVFGDQLIGYATVRGSIQRTTDGGLHWALIETPGVFWPG